MSEPTRYGLAIFPQHAELLAASAIDPDVARERGYVSVDTGTRLKPAGFTAAQRRAVPGLLIPTHGTDGTVRLHQYRADSPREVDGKAVKYETPTGHRLCLDVPPRARPALGDPAVSLWITEGARKADAAVTAGLCCIAVLGVDSWRGLPDWEDIRLRGREVVVCFDSDVMTKPGPARALARLTDWLAYRGAKVRHVILPTGDDGAKTGLDDHLAVGHSADELAALAQDAAPQLDAAAEDATALLGEVHAAYTRYVIWPSPEAADAMTLYTAATHAQTAWEHASRLVLKSPIKRCGKTRAQEVARELVHNPLPTTNISPAALARSINETDPPTLILDEADTVWGKKEQRSEGAEDLRGILNSGHSRGWPYVRWDAAKRERELCPTFAMAIIGGIGDMPDTIEDRAVVISMRRRAPGESVTQWRSRRAVPRLRALRDRLHGWVTASLDDLAVAEPELPAEDRAADEWEPLVAIADAAGGDWPERARKACQALASEDDSRDGTAGERLLADLQDIFGDATFLYSATITAALAKIDEAPWAEWRRTGLGREPINARGLADMLRPWRIKSRNGREDGTGNVAKGYYAEDLADAWERYNRCTATNAQSPQASHVADRVADDDSRPLHRLTSSNCPM